MMGDTNLCFRKWTSTSNQDQNLINTIKDTQTAAGLDQVVDVDTRVQAVDDQIESSIIDHTYTNCTQLLQQVNIN